MIVRSDRTKLHPLFPSIFPGLRLNGRVRSRLRATVAQIISSPCLCSGLPPGLHCLPRGRRSAGTAHVLVVRPFGRRALCGERVAFRRSTAAIFVAVTVLLRSDRWGLPLPLSRQHSRRPSSDRVQPLKAAPSSGADGDCASRDEVTSLACGRRIPAPPPNVSGRRPQ